MSQSCDAVLIDDNPWIREHWFARLKAHGKRLRGFESGEDFLKANEPVGLRTPIFVDLMLADNACPGEQLLMRLHRGGYKNLFLATAFDTSTLSVQRYLRGVVGKEPPQWLLSTDEAEPWQLSSAERQNLLIRMTEGEQQIFKRRMDRFYGAIYGYEGDMILGDVPETVRRAWEWGIYHSLSDPALDATIQEGWRKWAEETSR